MNDLTQSSRVPNWCKGVLLAGMLLFAFYASTHMVAAGDTWVALACGRHFDQHGVDNVEPFSFNSHPAGPSQETLAKWPEWMHGMILKWHPTGWINQNWLTHLTYYKLASWFGSDGEFNYNTLVVWKFALYTLTVFCAFAIGKTIGAGWFLSSAAACLAMVIGRSFFDIRPAGYSSLLTPAFVLVLALATYKHWRWIWLLVPLVVFWANVHGGYIYAFIMMVPFIGVHLLLLLPKRWTFGLGCIGLWLVLYMMSYKFLTNNYFVEYQQFLNPQFQPVSLLNSNLFVAWVVLAAISIGLTAWRKISAAQFYLYHMIAGLVFFAALLSRYLVLGPKQTNLNPQFRELLQYHISSSQFSFLMLAAFALLLILAMTFKKERFIVLPVRGVFHTVGAAIAAFIAMVIFNPYHLTNLTHTFEISVSKHAESWRMVNEWKPAFDWMDKTSKASNPVGDEEWFLVFCILSAVVVAGWLIVYLAMRPRPAAKGSWKASAADQAAIAAQWPKVDLAIILISLLTIYMAIQSRRFIALTGSVSAPAIFLLIRQIGQMVTTRYPLARAEGFEPSALRRWKTLGGGAVAMVLLGLGIFWGIKFHRVYLAPWPSEHQYTSVFMRMTASHMKPFEVCRFINDNQLTGRMFNHWTEGGAVAFGQTPDPKTGEIPLKLFMDGRAQAAYNHSTFLLWNEISSGGPLAKSLLQQGKKVLNWSTEDFKTVGEWIDKQLKTRDVWVTLMPVSQDQPDTIFMRSLRTLPNWKTAYTDRMQRLLVDVDSPQGKQLIGDVLDGTAKFPDKVSESLTRTTAIIENNHVQRMDDLYAIARQGVEVFPHPSTLIAMSRVSGVPAFRTKVTEDMKNYVADFEQNRDAYQEQDGFLYRLSSAEVAATYLSQRDEPSARPRWAQEVERYKAQSQEMRLNRVW